MQNRENRTPAPPHVRTVQSAPKNEVPAPAARTGRPPRRNGELQLKSQRAAVPVAAHGDENIVRVHKGVDRVMLALILLLLALGSIMVFSASYPSALAEYGDSLHYIKRQMMFIVVGVFFMLIASYIPTKIYRVLTPGVFGIAVFLLIIVLIPGVGISNGVARRWLGLRGTSFTFQPSETMKAALVLMLAWYIDKYNHFVLDRKDFKKYFLKGTAIPCMILGIACVLVMLEKHLSGTIILGIIGMGTMFIGGVHLGGMLGIAAVGGAAAVGLFLWTNPYAAERVLTFFDNNADVLDEKWQTVQGLLAIGSGGTLGVGLGGSRQKYSYVSEAQNDFIFTIWCEEMGFVGAVVLIVLYLAFVWRGYVIAMRAPDTYSALVVFGIITQIGVQAFLNIGVVTDILPNTGIALPFFSYGGTSLIILLVEMGVVLSISKHSYQKKV